MESGAQIDSIHSATLISISSLLCAVIVYSPSLVLLHAVVSCLLLAPWCLVGWSDPFSITLSGLFVRPDNSLCPGLTSHAPCQPFQTAYYFVQELDDGWGVLPKRWSPAYYAPRIRKRYPIMLIRVPDFRVSRPSPAVKSSWIANLYG